MPGKPSNSFRLLLAWFLVTFVAGAAAESPPAAELRVTGLGWLGNRKAEKTLELLRDRSDRAILNANAIEDASLILFSQLTTDGYLAPSMTADLTLDDGRKVQYPLDAQLEHVLPRPLHAKAVTLQVKRGRRFVLEKVAFEGLHALPETEALTFFVGDSFLVTLDAERLYSPERLNRSVANLQFELQQRGYADAAVEAANPTVDQATGLAHVTVVVREGQLWRVAALHLETTDGSAVPTDLAAGRIERPWTPQWRQDTMQAIRRWYYEHGHPDVQVRLAMADAAPGDGAHRVSVTAQITPGAEVHLQGVRFVGNNHTREATLRKRVPVQAGDLLDRTKLDDGLSRLARLGVFNNIALDYEPPDGPERTAVYRFTEGRLQEVNLLAGYGSYEQLRGGIEWRQFNLFGRAHSSDLTIVQSMKSSKADYTYTVPEIFGTADGSAQLFGLRREELAFLREEYGATISLHWPLRALGASLTTGYTYENLQNIDNELATHTTDESNTKSASLDFGFVKDKRDNPLTPHRGFRIFARTSLASKVLGGESDYQVLSLGGAWHHPLGHGRWVHIGFVHSVITTLGAPEGSEPPVNVLLYPGGDSSIRGYTDGEAAPRAANGDFVGAKTTTVLNLELEQAITSKWTVVAFVDALAEAARLEDYPASEELYSVGLGLRYQTIVGPIRLEYGYNLNPRPLDPAGTLHFSIGFPF